ncbi:hypothetical protein G6F16_012428 [Rhizopus arrhizus]|nr:hypothetical protein G6F20_013029 [Rhizopus arrhizus]KAG0815832.1 hypothetical protein G6F18_013063 [Rhizopus arrhizus]KAG0820967.1 hypothetical protein G6F19_012172 [Rhizopus arrhizus]KAG0847016.1 hypothetical protein G6F17_012916 [Rhizopus arrhizus]KAG0862579.1 hypothetical protein G6F16_012428 [Rhizopus arrhizus]
MVLSAKINLVPNRATNNTNPSFLQTKRAWAQLLVGPTKTSSYGAQSTSQSVPPPTSMSSDVSTSHPSSPSSIKSPVFRIDRPILKALPNLNQIEQNKHYFEEKAFLYS